MPDSNELMSSREGTGCGGVIDGASPVVAPVPPVPHSCADHEEEEEEEDAWDAMQERQYARLLADGTHTSEQVQQMRREKRFKEEAAVCGVMIKTRAWEMDQTCTARDVFLCNAAALEGLGRWPEAIRLLQRALKMCPTETAITLALAKLHFKAGQKSEALTLCTAVYDDKGATSEDVADAYHLAGWVKIHGDDHTSAYTVWSDGAAATPDDPVLQTQQAKRQCWDSDDRAAVEPGLVGDGAHGDGRYNVESDLDAFEVAPCMLHRTPALALFDDASQRHRLVFRTRQPVLTREECDRVCGIVDKFHLRERGGMWSTVRKATVKTTDVAVEVLTETARVPGIFDLKDIPELRPWLRQLLKSRLCPMIAAAYPRLADGSSVVDVVTGESRLRVHDAFIVRYDAENDGSLSLPEHSDTSAVSFTVALNSSDGTFDGGGTWFEALGERGCVVDADVGQAVAFAGPLRHAGYPITRGTRIILVLFMYVQGFPYGHFLDAYRAEHGCCRAETDNGKDGGDLKRPSGDDPGGYVVYKETVQLMEMLDKQVAKSVLE